MNSLVFLPASSIVNLTGNNRSQRPVNRDKWPPCSQTCPANEDIQSWFALASEGKWEDAWRKITERNPLPSVMGRVCYHPCEFNCIRTGLDDSVNIHSLERYIGDLALRNGWHHTPLVDTQRNEKIAIIGAGPAGLSCAFQLARRGYSVTIFDSKSNPGGMLYSAIPAYRLDKTVLLKEINAILALGVKLKLNTAIQTHEDLASVEKEFDALFVAIGAQRPRYIEQLGQSDHNVMSGVAFLAQINSENPPKLPDKVAVIGAGNSAIDAARCARRLGAEAFVVCPQHPNSIQESHPGTEIPASLNEIKRAESEGVQILYGRGLKRLVRSGEHLSGIEIGRVDRLYDSGGNFNPQLFEGTEEYLQVGLLVYAIGQEVDWTGLESVTEQNHDKTVIAGDAAGLPRFMSTAVGSGYQGAMSIIAALTGIPPVYEHHNKAEISQANIILEYYPKVARNEEYAMLDWREAGERNSTYSEEQAASEAKRCLSCGVCFNCDNCWHFCPDAAVIKKTSGYEFDYDYCKGCGICAQECPSGYITMESVNV